MFEVYYKAPVDTEREQHVGAVVSRHNGLISYHEEPKPDDISQTVVVTCEFNDYESANAAASELRRIGEHVEGPTDYGD